MIPGYGTLREDKTPQIHISHSHQLGSNPSIYSGGIGHGSQHSTGSLDQVTSPTSHSAKPINTGEDLYSWMAKQQEFIKDNDKGNLKGNWVRSTLRYYHIIIAVLINPPMLKYTLMRKYERKFIYVNSYALFHFRFLLTQVFRTEQKSMKVHLTRRHRYRTVICISNVRSTKVSSLFISYRTQKLTL